MDVGIVIPCFNEAQRLDEARLLELLAGPSWRLFFVDDGSTDATGARLEALAAHDPRVDVLHLERNSGKAEAVRQGLLRALPHCQVVAYYDADLATPPAEMVRIIKVLEETPAVTMALGARVALLGRDIRRQPARHYLGRVFASLASLTLRLRVYDTQCGAKALRVGPRLAHVLSAPFGSRWVFDVELMARLLREGARPEEFLEVPLTQWHDVAGSKLRPGAMVHALIELARIASY